MRILFVANGYPPAEKGGVETYTYQLANSLFARGHQVQVFCRFNAPDHSDFEVFQDCVDEIPVTRLVNDFKHIDRLERTYQDTIVERIFEEILDQTQFDLIHFNQLIGLSCRLPQIASARGIPSVFTMHDYWPFCARINLVDWQNNLCPGLMQGADCLTCMSGGQPGWQMDLLRPLKRLLPFKFRQIVRRNILMQGSRLHILQMQADDFLTRFQAYKESLLSVQRILAPSEYVRRQFAANGYPENRIEILPLGVSKPDPAVEPDSKSENRVLTFGFVGSLVPTKGVDLLIKSFIRLAGRDLRLLIFGPKEVAPPDYWRLLNRLAKEDPRIYFMGAFNQEQRTSVYRQIDVVVIPSRFPESFSLVARESLIHGLPVIAARIGALPEIIQPGINGDLFSPGSEDDLLRSLQSAVQDRSRFSQEIQPTPDSVPDLEHHASAIESIYREITASPSHPK